MKHSNEFKIINEKTILTPWEIFYRITTIFERGYIKDEKKQQFSFRDGIVVTFNKTEKGYTIKFETNLKYKDRGEL